MFEIFTTLCGWAVIVLLSEWLWRRKILAGEYARKIIHIFISISIAFAPTYLSWRQIQLIGLIGLVMVIMARYTGAIKSAYDVRRNSWGEFFGPLSILVLTLFEPPTILFVIVILHLGLGDGLAAIIGTRYGKSNRYKIFGYTKSVAGTFTFFMTSICITLGVILFGNAGLFSELWPLLIILPLATAVVENIGVYGMDNALIVLTTSLIVNSFI